MAYYGRSTFVQCAEEQKRYGVCSQLTICVVQNTRSADYVHSYFPSDFFVVVSSIDESMERLLNGTSCNAIASDRSDLVGVTFSDSDGDFILGDKLVTKEPFAIVTRSGDQEFSDIINWVIQALFYGEEQDLVKDLSLCQNYTEVPSHPTELNFLNAVHCVGNYGEVLFGGDQNDRFMNRINNGTSGMIYAVPFGDLELEERDIGDAEDAIEDSILGSIRNISSLNCGVVVPDNFTGNISTSDNLVGMNVEYCQTLAAALFNSNAGAAKIMAYKDSEKDTYFAALSNGTVDVLAGALIEHKYDFASSVSLEGFDFSTPYFYGNETGT